MGRTAAKPVCRFAMVLDHVLMVVREGRLAAEVVCVAVEDSVLRPLRDKISARAFDFFRIPESTP